MMFSEINKKQILRRLATVRGHVAAIEKMIEENRDCEDVLFQMNAVNMALKKAMLSTFDHAMTACEDTEEIRRITSQVMKVL